MSIFKKTETDKKVEAAIDKHAGKVAALILLALSGWGLSSCMAPDTPEEARANEVRQYLRKCEFWGYNNEAYELGGARKYKDYAFVTYIKYVKSREDVDPTLPTDQCEARFEQGERDARVAFKAGKVDMQ